MSRNFKGSSIYRRERKGVEPRSRGFSMFRLEPRAVTWLKPNREKPRERGSKTDRMPNHPPSTAGLDRFAGSPVNGAKDRRLGPLSVRARTEGRRRTKQGRRRRDPATFSPHMPPFPRMGRDGRCVARGRIACRRPPMAGSGLTLDIPTTAALSGISPSRNESVEIVYQTAAIRQIAS
jgi:hypothetical protein